jgi:hypothetical protein
MKKLNVKDIIHSQSARYSIRQVVKNYLNHKNIPIVLISGNSPPKLTGESFCWRTNGGTYISHPSAYSKVGWSNMNYCCSTLRIEVGENWKIKFDTNQLEYLHSSLKKLGYVINYDCKNYYVSKLDMNITIPKKLFRTQVYKMITSLIIFN